MTALSAIVDESIFKESSIIDNAHSHPHQQSRSDETFSSFEILKKWDEQDIEYQQHHEIVDGELGRLRKRVSPANPSVNSSSSNRVYNVLIMFITLLD